MERWRYQGSLHPLRESKLPLVKEEKLSFTSLLGYSGWRHCHSDLLERLGHAIVSLPKVNPLETKRLATGKGHEHMIG